MREIKFRVWNIQKTEFNIIDFRNTGWIMITNETNGEIQQFTGLKDKNGKDIYEGDVYHQGDKNIKYKVIFENGCFIGNQIGNKSLAGLKHFIKDIEVIGNILENNNLIK